MTSMHQPNSVTTPVGEQPAERVLDDREMRRFMPPQAPLSMPQQDLTPRFSLRQALAAVGLNTASRQGSEL